MYICFSIINYLSIIYHLSCPSIHPSNLLLSIYTSTPEGLNKSQMTEPPSKSLWPGLAVCVHRDLWTDHPTARPNPPWLPPSTKDPVSSAIWERVFSAPLWFSAITREHQHCQFRGGGTLWRAWPVWHYGYFCYLLKHEDQYVIYNMRSEQCFLFFPLLPVVKHS